jgi:hypothetical protein
VPFKPIAATLKNLAAMQLADGAKNFHFININISPMILTNNPLPIPAL